MRNECQISIVSPVPDPDPAQDSDWCFPDNEEGILSAVKAGATHLWANTILFATHPLQISERLTEYSKSISVVGQPPLLVDAYDDKALVNGMMKSRGGLTVATFTTLTASDDISKTLENKNLRFPLVAKPIRGRGSHGVKLCRDEETLQAHVRYLFSESPNIIIEQYLDGEEATVTVMPPSAANPESYWALPIVSRFNHSDGIAPYNGTVAVTTNSRVITRSEYEQDPAYGRASGECEKVAAMLKATAPIRIDIRRFKEGSDFALFDVNMKPVSTEDPSRSARMFDINYRT